MTRQEIAGVMRALGLSINATFIPYSISRNAPKPENEGWLSLNWQVELRRNGTLILCTPYAAGSGHAPAARSKVFRTAGDRAKMIAWECEHGRVARGMWVSGTQSPMFPGNRIEPDPCDVIASIVAESYVIDCASFDDWAQNYGYDTDSRKAEQAYRVCLANALALRSSVGDEGLRLLRDACQDY